MFSDKNGAMFSANGCERYVLWRKWNAQKPMLLFVGLNPSKANEQQDDATTRKLVALSKALGFGGCFLTNCFTQVATDPKDLCPKGNWSKNQYWINTAAEKCGEVVFGWGNHPLVIRMQRDSYFKKRFPNAKCLGRNKNGSPKHPLYLPLATKLTPFA